MFDMSRMNPHVPILGREVVVTGIGGYDGTNPLRQCWRRRSLLNLLRDHKTTVARVLFSLTVGGLVAAERGGKTYTAIAASGGSDYAARLAANRVAAITLAFSSLLFLLFFSALKLIGVVNERRKNKKVENESH